MKNDNISYYLKYALDFLFLRNPYSTSMGIILGCAIHSFIPVFNNWSIDVINFDLAKVTLYGWIFIGIFLFNLPSWILYDKVPKDVEQLIDIIEKGKKAGISDLEIKQRYRQLIQKYMEKVSLREDFEKNLKNVQKEIKRKGH